MNSFKPVPVFVVRADRRLAELNVPSSVDTYGWLVVFFEFGFTPVAKPVSDDCAYPLQLFKVPKRFFGLGM
jgi:hypothetical protein